MPEQQVAVVEGPKGKAEIIEVTERGTPTIYHVVFAGQRETFRSLGEAYITAGERVGTKT